MTKRTRENISSDVLGPSWPDFGWIPAPRYILRRDRVLRLMKQFPKGNLLEVGCGAGALLHELVPSGFTCHGLETSPQALDLATRIRDSGSVEINLVSVPVPEWEDHFDVLVALEVLEHVEDDSGILREWAGWMKRSSRLVLSVPAHRIRWGPADEWAGHFRRYDRIDIEHVLENNGFDIESIECYGFPIGNILDVAGRRYYQRSIILDEHGNPDRAANNARSGVDRADFSRMHRLVSSFPARCFMRSALWMQHLSRTTQLGTGFVVVARKR